MYKKSIFLLYFILLFPVAYSQQLYPDIVIETTFGNMVIRLYDDTPLHSENFVKLVKEGYYNHQLFHRVINNFMIQAGDPDSKDAKSGTMLGSGGPSYTIPAEFNPQYYHKKGAVAAARQDDTRNPQRASSGSQFYIVQGKKSSPEQLQQWEKQGTHIPFTEEQIIEYTTHGVTPHLDYSYTVFGELLSGTEVLDSIAAQPVDSFNRPVSDIRILKMYTQKR
jgi:peptidyl-prolyl cis-trans isomerase B (cyclophilin B)